MTAPLNPSIADSSTGTLANVRDAMSCRSDFDPAPEHYASHTNIFEVLTALEALTIEDEILI